IRARRRRPSCGPPPPNVGPPRSPPRERSSSLRDSSTLLRPSTSSIGDSATQTNRLQAPRSSDAGRAAQRGGKMLVIRLPGHYLSAPVLVGSSFRGNVGCFFSRPHGSQAISNKKI